MSSLPSRSTVEPNPAISCAAARASSRSCSAGTTRCTSPSRCASVASMRRPGQRELARRAGTRGVRDRREHDRREEPDPDLGERHLRPLGGEHDVAGGHESKTAGERVTVRGDHDRHVERRNDRHELSPHRARLVVLRGALPAVALELAEVAAGAEARAVAVEQDDADVVVGVRGAQMRRSARRPSRS